MNGFTSGCSRLVAVVVAMFLVDSTVGQIPDWSTNRNVDEYQGVERGQGGESAQGILGSWAWDPFYYDDRAPLYLRTEYVKWWLSGNSLPPLVTTGPVGAAPTLGAPGTSVMFGGNEVDAGGRGGLRGTLGVRLAHWFETDLVLEGQLIILGNDGQNSGDFFAGSADAPVLGRPFYNTQTAVQDVIAVAAPGLLFPDPVTGLPDPTQVLDAAQIQSTSTSDFDAGGVVMRLTGTEGDGYWIDLLAGYRYLRLQERLAMRQFQSFSDPGFPDRTSTVDIRDSFSTWSEFHGGDFGAVTCVERGPVTLEMLTKVAIGNMHQILDIVGTTSVTRPDAPRDVAANFGGLAAPSNIGRYTSDRLTAVPEIGITLRRSIARSAAVTVGYTLIAIPGALRSGDQIDTALDPSQATPHPAASLNDSVVWLQGINVGLEW